ncbi:hypothetical protein bcgnr5372_38590 [Bacillus luti]|nr:glucosaminidase domain-containing protein [Bacillus cereus]HDR8327241.1 glucosaminidase domain-containing protein [Bacillus cereus]HDR8336431.1 glucosaminidase domain-containing protein [Bacillus cereus]
MKKKMMALTAAVTFAGVVWGCNNLTNETEHKVEASQTKVAPSHGEITKNSSFNAESTIKGTKVISAEAINELFKTDKESKLIGLGDAVYKVSIENGIEPGFIAALMYYETINGQSKFVTEKNNVLGVLDKSGNGAVTFKKFASLEEGLTEQVVNFRQSYLNKGLVTLDKFGKRYAPTWDKQVNNGKEWSDVISEIMNKQLDIQNKL